jgi:GH43 family beta-xylosidase
LVITPDQPWEDINGTRLWNEGPSVLKHNGKYYMTYSANGFNTHEYCVAYATANNPFGPWRKASENPILKANMSIGISGPGHNSFAWSPDGTELFMIYHIHTFPDKPNGNRTVCIDRVQFKNGKMVVYGPTKSPQPYPKSN